MSKISKSARNQECQIRLIGICNGIDETTVLCHLNGGGMGYKHSDIHAAYGCNNCHDAVDMRRFKGQYTPEQLKQAHLEGVIRTQTILLNDGLLEVK